MASPAVTGTDNPRPNAVVNTTFLPSNTSFHQSVADVWSSTVATLAGSAAPDWTRPSQRTTLKDQTTLVALVVMGALVPAIFLTVFFLVWRRRRKDLVARRTQMLLQSTQDFALEDYTSEVKATRPPNRL